MGAPHSPWGPLLPTSLLDAPPTLVNPGPSRGRTQGLPPVNGLRMFAAMNETQTSDWCRTSGRKAEPSRFSSVTRELCPGPEQAP